MNHPYALQVIPDGDGNWRWVLLAPTDDPLVFAEHSAADCDFDTYDAAAHAGLVALGNADGQLVEDERADPVGDGCWAIRRRWRGPWRCWIRYAGSARRRLGFAPVVQSL